MASQDMMVREHGTKRGCAEQGPGKASGIFRNWKENV